MLFFAAAISVATLGSATMISAQPNVITLGTRPYYLVDEMKSSPLKDKLGKQRLPVAEFESNRIVVFIH